MRLYILPISLFFICFGTLKAQILDADEYNFAFQVKQVDEFIERFNGDTSTLLYEYRSKKFPDETMDRELMIRTLFDNQRPKWDMKLVHSFVEEIVDEKKPLYLSFYDEDWYALLDCNVSYKGKNERAFITLQVQKEEDYSSKWVIRGVMADFLKLPGNESDQVFLNPVSHGTDFMNLGQLFKADKRHIKSYLYRNFHPGGLALFIHELIDGNIDFGQINSISYHFLQLDGWAFTLRKIYRDSPNSGWLISDLQRLDRKNKDAYRRKILYLD